MAHVKQRHGITIGQQTAEHVKFEIGSAWPVEDDLTAEVKGRDLVSGLPKTVTLTRRGGPRGARGAAARDHRDDQGDARAHPSGAGGRRRAAGDHAGRRGSLLQGFDERVRVETKMSTYLAESPLTCVVIGSGRSLEEFDVMSAARRAAGGGGSDGGST